MQGTIPYLGTFLTDLVMMDTAMKDYTEVRHFTCFLIAISFLVFFYLPWQVFIYVISCFFYLLSQGGLINFEKRRKVNKILLFV